MLKNTFVMAKKVVTAANKHFHTKEMRAFFEHGQWWVTNHKTGAQYSVNDAEGIGTTNGFDFEEVTPAQD